MKRGCEAVLADLGEFEGKPLARSLRAAGMKLVMKVGGASGPLYGTLLMELGKRLPPISLARRTRRCFRGGDRGA